MAKQQTDGLMRLEERYAGYKVYERGGEKIGKVDELFVDEYDQPEYIGVNMGFLGTKSTLIPMDIVREDEELRVLEVSQPKSMIKEGPTFDDGEKITPEYEERVRSYYGLGSFKGSAKRGAYGTYYREDSEGDASSRPLREGYLGEKREGLRRTSTDLGEGENELRVQRTEEELVSGTREREIGGVHLRKRVRTGRERVRVPKRREEVHVERVPVDREASEAEIGEEEFFVPVIEEEVVVEKRPVAKEEIHLRKEVVEEEEVVERDVRKEEVDIDDETERQVVLEHGLDTDN